MLLSFLDHFCGGEISTVVAIFCLEEQLQDCLNLLGSVLFSELNMYSIRTIYIQELYTLYLRMTDICGTCMYLYLKGKVEI